MSPAYQSGARRFFPKAEGGIRKFVGWVIT